MLVFELVVAVKFHVYKVFPQGENSQLAISELFSTASASAITFILKAIIYEERRAFRMMRKIIVTKEILD